MKNVDAAIDCINLPPFINMPPTVKPNKTFDLKRSTQESIAVCGRPDQMIKGERLVAMDLIAFFIDRRVQPL